MPGRSAPLSGMRLREYRAQLAIEGLVTCVASRQDAVAFHVRCMAPGDREAWTDLFFRQAIGKRTQARRTEGRAGAALGVGIDADAEHIGQQL